MKNSYKLATAGATLLFAAVGAHAQCTNSVSRFYADFDAGAAFQQNTDIPQPINSTTGTLKFDTGFRVAAGVGYKITDSFAAEFESGIIRNTINQVGIQPLSSLGAKASLDEIPLLLNGVYTFPLKGHFKPYVGVGVGAMLGVFNSENIPQSFSPGANPHFDDTDYTFAYQAEIGFKYALSRHLDLGLAYKFTGTTDNTWSDNNVTMKTDGTLTHTIAATLTWRF